MRILIFVALLLTGCSHEFTRPGATAQDFDKDSTDCMVKTNQAGMRGWPAQNFYNRCMSGQGWTKN